jgi:hypothetical protein
LQSLDVLQKPASLIVGRLACLSGYNSGAKLGLCVTEARSQVIEFLRGMRSTKAGACKDWSERGKLKAFGLNDKSCWL